MKTAMQVIESSVAADESRAEARGANRAMMQLARPSTIRKPRVFKDGNQWCALEGDNIQEGICGFGTTPDRACQQFDLAWLNERIAFPMEPKHD